MSIWVILALIACGLGIFVCALASLLVLFGLAGMDDE